MVMATLPMWMAGYVIQSQNSVIRHYDDPRPLEKWHILDDQDMPLEEDMSDTLELDMKVETERISQELLNSTESHLFGMVPQVKSSPRPSLHIHGSDSMP